MNMSYQERDLRSAINAARRVYADAHKAGDMIAKIYLTRKINAMEHRLLVIVEGVQP